MPNDLMDRDEPTTCADCGEPVSPTLYPGSDRHPRCEDMETAELADDQELQMQPRDLEAEVVAVLHKSPMMEWRGPATGRVVCLRLKPDGSVEMTWRNHVWLELDDSVRSRVYADFLEQVDP